MATAVVEPTTVEEEEEREFLVASELRDVGQVVSTRRRTATLAVSLLAAGCGALAYQGGRPGARSEGRSAARVEAAIAFDTSAACSGQDEDCSKSKCCRVPDAKCFEKNEFWAACNQTCAPGVHPGEDDKGWTCNLLSKDGGAKPPACVGKGADCSDAKCCTEADAKCFRKDKYWATCMVRCDPGVHENDEDKKPWTCEALEPSAPHKIPAWAKPLPEVSTPPIICDAGPIPPIPQWSGYQGPPAHIKVLTYNLYWWNLFGMRGGNGKSAGKLIQDTNAPLPWDLMGFQECEDGHRVLADANMLEQMELYQFDVLTKTSAICQAFRKNAFNLIAKGGGFVAEDGKRQHFGKRAIQWMRLVHRASGKTVFFANHHGPLPQQSGGKCGGAITGLHILRVIGANARPGDAIILTGDFNSSPGSDTLRVIGQQLHDFVPAGIDNVFSNLGPGSLVRKMDIGSGGSDHHAQLAVFQLGMAAPGAGAFMQK